MHEVAQRPSERRSLEVNLFRLNGFKSHYKFTREKSLTVLLVTCHDVTDRIFDPSISRQTGMKRWHNQPEKLLDGVIIKGGLLSSTKKEPLHFAPLDTVWTPGTGFTSILGNMKRDYEKCKPRGLFSEFYGRFSSAASKGTGVHSVCDPDYTNFWTDEGKLPTYPSPKPTFCPKWEVSVNAGLGEAWVGSFPERYNDPSAGPL